MITINPVKLNTQITFRNNTNNNNTKTGLIALDKNSGNRINFEKDLYITENADSVRSNPIKALAFNVVKAYNIFTKPQNKSQKTNSNYVHIPYMA